MKVTTNSAPLPVWQGGELRCIERRDETPDSASFTLTSDTQTRFKYKPGQFATIGAEIGGHRHYRAYSMSSSPDRDDAITITIRRVQDGLVSNFMLDNFKVGDRIDALPLAGDFILSAEDIVEKLVMLSAGSGVTPVMSMIRWVLRHHPEADIHFIYSARSEQDIIFRDELLEIAKKHPNFRLDLFLDNAEGRVGRHDGFLTPERLDRLLEDAPAGRYFLCGSKQYMEMIENWHRRRGLPAMHFNKESFTPTELPAATPGGQVFELSVPAFDKKLSINEGQSLLEIMEPEGIPIIGACRSGVCGSCKCKVVEGEVERISTATLTPEEVTAGFVLACSTRAKSDVVIDL